MSPGLRGPRQLPRHRCEAKASRDDGDVPERPGHCWSPSATPPSRAPPRRPHSPSPALGERAQVRPHLCLVRAVVCERAGAKTPTIADYRGDDRLTRDSYRFPRFLLAWGVSLLARPSLLKRPWWRAWLARRAVSLLRVLFNSTWPRAVAGLVCVGGGGAPRSRYLRRPEGLWLLHRSDAGDTCRAA